ncbi:hypothetical protein V8D89_006773 [Ganoderma adspersum]
MQSWVCNVLIYGIFAALSIARLVNWGIFLRTVTKELNKPGTDTLTVALYALKLSNGRAEWFMQCALDLYASILFLVRLNEAHVVRGRREGLGSIITNGGYNSYSSRLKALFWIAVFNFVFPVILGSIWDQHRILNFSAFLSFIAVSDPFTSEQYGAINVVTDRARRRGPRLTSGTVYAITFLCVLNFRETKSSVAIFDSGTYGLKVIERTNRRAAAETWYVPHIPDNDPAINISVTMELENGRNWDGPKKHHDETSSSDLDSGRTLSPRYRARRHSPQNY